MSRSIRIELAIYLHQIRLIPQEKPSSQGILQSRVRSVRHPARALRVERRCEVRQVGVRVHIVESRSAFPPSLLRSTAMTTSKNSALRPV